MERLEPTAITHEKKGTWSEPNLYEDMFQPLIFPGVFPLKNSPKNQVHLRQLEASQRLYHSVGHLAGGAFIHQVKRWEFRFFLGGGAKSARCYFLEVQKALMLWRCFFPSRERSHIPPNGKKGSIIDSKHALILWGGYVIVPQEAIYQRSCNKWVIVVW